MGYLAVQKQVLQVVRKFVPERTRAQIHLSGWTGQVQDTTGSLTGMAGIIARGRWEGGPCSQHGRILPHASWPACTNPVPGGKRLAPSSSWMHMLIAMEEAGSSALL